MTPELDMEQYEKKQVPIIDQYAKMFGDKEVVRICKEHNINPDKLTEADNDDMFKMCGQMLKEMKDLAKGEKPRVEQKEGFKKAMDDYVSYEELLTEAHKRWVETGFSMHTELLHLNENKETGVLIRAIVKSTITVSIKGTMFQYTGIGDADDTNTTGQIKVAKIRMAETRANARALRSALGIGKTAREELSEK